MKKIISSVILVLFIVLSFGGLYYLTTKYHYISSFETLNNYLYFFLWILIWFFIHAVIHELGHLVWGLICGYRLLSFRFLFFEIYRLNDHFKFKLSSLEGKVGQTVFCDLTDKNRKHSYLIIGGILNLLLTVGILVTLLKVNPFIDYFYTNSRFISGIYVGIFYVLFTLIPFFLFSNNDCSLFVMMFNKEANESYKIIGQAKYSLSNGGAYKDLAIKPINNPQNEMEGERCLLYYYQLIDRDLDGASSLAASEYLQSLYNNNEVTGLIRGWINLEYIYSIIMDNPKLAKKIYQELKPGVKRLLDKSYSPYFVRINYAIHKEILKSLNENIIKETKELIARSKFQADVDINQKLFTKYYKSNNK